MSALRERPIAIAISDLHLSLTQPACRADKNWLETQAYYLKQVKDYAGGLPVLCAGDIFDRWNPPPELIHFALRHLPDGMICVPGQHDLPNHRTDQMNRSGYGVLKEAGKIDDIGGGFKYWKDLTIYGFGWGEKLEPPTQEMDHLSVALIHQYCWTAENHYPGAPEEAHLSAFMEPLRKYDVAIFGDNHKGFLKKLKTGTTVLNVGGFIRRKSDEIDYHPSIGVIFEDGTVRRRELDTSIDRFHEVPADRPENSLDMRAFLNGLEGLGEHGLNFKEAVENHLRREDVDEETRQIILGALEPK